MLFAGYEYLKFQSQYSNSNAATLNSKPETRNVLISIFAI